MQVIFRNNAGINFAAALDLQFYSGFFAFILLRYAFPRWSMGTRKNWRSNVGFGIKVPLMSEEDFLSTGSRGSGIQLTVDRRFSRDSWIINLGAVFPGKFKQTDFQPPDLAFIHVSWHHRFRRWSNTRSYFQTLMAKHPYRELVDSDLGKLELQITAGLKWDTTFGIIGLGLTENILNFDNTPDVGLHFTWGILHQ